MNPPKNEQEKNAKNENAAAKVGIPLAFFLVDTVKTAESGLLTQEGFSTFAEHYSPCGRG